MFSKPERFSSRMLLVISGILILLGSVYAKDTLTVRLADDALYLKQKDALHAAIAGLVVPGGANIYSENYLAGGIFAVLECAGIVGAILATSGNPTGQQVAISVSCLSILADVYSGMISTNSFKRQRDVEAYRPTYSPSTRYSADENSDNLSVSHLVPKGSNQSDCKNNLAPRLAKSSIGGVDESKWGYFDCTGKEIIPAMFDNARDFSEGLAAVKNNGKWGFIDSTGRCVIRYDFDNAKSFKDETANVILGGEKGYIDKAGRFYKGGW